MAGFAHRVCSTEGSEEYTHRLHCIMSAQLGIKETEAFFMGAGRHNDTS